VDPGLGRSQGKGGTDWIRGLQGRQLDRRLLLCTEAIISQAVPRIHYDELQKGLSNERIAEIKEAGVVIVRGAVSKEVPSDLHFKRYSC